MSMDMQACWTLTFNFEYLNTKTVSCGIKCSIRDSHSAMMLNDVYSLVQSIIKHLYYFIVVLLYCASNISGFIFNEEFIPNHDIKNYFFYIDLHQRTDRHWRINTLPKGGETPPGEVKSGGGSRRSPNSVPQLNVSVRRRPNNGWGIPSPNSVPYKFRLVVATTRYPQILFFVRRGLAKSGGSLLIVPTHYTDIFSRSREGERANNGEGRRAKTKVRGGGQVPPLFRFFAMGGGGHGRISPCIRQCRSLCLLSRDNLR